MRKRVLSCFMAVCMVFGLIPFMPTATVNAANMANELVSIAKGELGNGYSKYTHYVGSIGGRYDYAWCAAFVSWCGNQAGVSCIGKTASCYEQYRYMTSHGGKEVSTPQAGDIVFFYCNNCSGTVNQWCHIGIMIDSTTSIDGNYDNRVAYDRSYSHYGSLGYKHSGGIEKKYVRPNYSSTSTQAMLPGTVDTSWDVPANVTASRRISTYDQWGNVESNHYIDPGDNCYISEVYTNGFVKIQYPVSNGKRWAYAKASDFSLNRVNSLPSTNLHAWFSADKMGGEASNVRLGENLYLCYRVETKDGKLLDPSIGNYSIKETIYFPDGSSYPYNYGKGNNNWIRAQLVQWGTYRGVVEISGDYTGTVEVSYTLKRPNDIVLDTWFSQTAMGNNVSYLEKGKSYYMCYGIKCDNKDYFNKYANVDYSVTQAVYGPDGKKVYEYTYNKSDNNWIRFTATQTGTYKGITTIKGYFNASDTMTCVCKDTSKPKLNSIDITTYPKKLVYTVGEPIDTSGMVVKAYYSDKTSRNITGYKVSGSTNQAGGQYVTVSYTENGITATDRFAISVNEKKKETVTLTYEPFGGTMAQTKQTAAKQQNVTLLKEKPKKSIWISFDSNGGNSTPDKVELQMQFIDWSCTRNSAVRHYKSGETFYADANYYLFANYASAKLSYLPDVKRDGYVFEGWYLQDGAKVTTNTTFAKNSTLTAKWTKAPEVHKHTPGKWETVREATETATGEQVLRCVECGEIMKTETIPVLADTDTEDIEDIPFINEDDLDSEDDFDDEFEDETLVVGDEITTDYEIYTITKTGDQPAVEYTELFDEDMTEVVIPESVTIDGVTYKVTSVAPKAFYKNTSVKQVTIAGAVTEIGSKSFYGCTSLKRVVILSTKMESDAIGQNAFKKVAKNIKAYVPATKYKAYKKMLKKAGIGSKAKIYKF